MDNFQTKYKILQKIGEGSFSEVLKCENRETGVCYAAKRLKKIFKSNEGVLNCAEIIAAQKIPHHPNILSLLEFHYDSFSQKAVFLFELMDMSMYEFLKSRTRRFPEHRVRAFLYQILKGLNHLHVHGLFHRDVKPENILIKLTNSKKCNECIKLADLGSVRGIYSDPPYTEYISTRWYRSPECLLTIGNYGSKMDIWATGCVFYEMLTLKPLFPGSNEVDQLHKIHAILGTPSGKVLDKLKNKSSNCTSFPETTGTGLFNLLVGISDQGKKIMNLMLEYDPDKRINARRLLQHAYFDYSRFSEQKHDQPGSGRLKSSKNFIRIGDNNWVSDKHQINKIKVSKDEVEKKKKSSEANPKEELKNKVHLNKGETQRCNQMPKILKKEKSTKQHSAEVSKDKKLFKNVKAKDKEFSIKIRDKEFFIKAEGKESLIKVKNKEHLMKVYVKESLTRSLIKAKDKASLNNAKHTIIEKTLNTKHVIPGSKKTGSSSKKTKEKFSKCSKTTSNLPQLTKPLLTPGEILAKKYFQSKSFVQQHNNRVDRKKLEVLMQNSRNRYIFEDKNSKL